MATADVLNAALTQLATLATPNQTVTQLQAQIAAVQQELAGLQQQLIAAQGGVNSDAIAAQQAIVMIRQLARRSGGVNTGIVLNPPASVSPVAVTITFGSVAPSPSSVVAAQMKTVG